MVFCLVGVADPHVKSAVVGTSDNFVYDSQNQLLSPIDFETYIYSSLNHENDFLYYLKLSE